MSRIIKIQPVEEVFHINWNIGLYCNFDCMYCPSVVHNKTSHRKSFSEFKSNWMEILTKTLHLNRMYKITFTGGEPTANKDFLIFISWLDREYGHNISGIGFTTNGSASKKYYLQALELNKLEFISFSTHSEFFNEQKFFTTIKAVAARAKELNKSIHVNVMDEPWHQERIKIYAQWLTNENINFSVNKINFSQQIRSYPEQNSNQHLYNF